MRFAKMHGLGNDFVLFDAYHDPGVEHARDWSRLAPALCDRHVGIGADGVIVVCRPTGGGDCRMRIFNADGSEAEMCGNGIRCLPEFGRRYLDWSIAPVAVETCAGLRRVVPRCQAGRIVAVAVDMGRPELAPARVPVVPERLDLAEQAGAEYRLRWQGRVIPAVFVAMGNPHVVLFADGPAPWGAALDAREIGPALESHPAFPHRTNVHVVRITARDRAEVHTWERGAGLTRACGTGACATLVAGVVSGRLDRRAWIRLPGGELEIDWPAPDATVTMTGPAAFVFEGDVPI